MKNLIALCGAILVLSGCYSSDQLIDEAMCHVDEDCDDGDPMSADVCREQVCHHIRPTDSLPENPPMECSVDSDCSSTPFETRVCRDGVCVSISPTDHSTASMHEICDNGVDDDDDGLIDCDDEFCLTFDGC